MAMGLRLDEARDSPADQDDEGGEEEEGEEEEEDESSQSIGRATVNTSRNKNQICPQQRLAESLVRSDHVKGSFVRHT